MEELSILAKTLESKALAIKMETEKDREKLEKEKANFHKEKELMSQRYKIDDTIIELNVGGTHFTSFKSTLCKEENSMLAAMFSGRHPLTKDSKGRFFIDRDPVAFKVILDYLRTEQWHYTKNEISEKKLRTESDYYGLKPKTEFLQYSHDLDTNGVFYFLGADGTGPWKNPTETGKVVVTSSTPISGNGNLIVERKMNQSCYIAGTNSWFCFELRTATLQPTYYTLCSDTNQGYYTRNWDLEASTDGKKWQKLRSHLNDLSFSGPSQAHSWPVTSTGYFSYFRVLQTGINSSLNTHFMIGGFELYGDLVADFQEY